ncbi:MAG: DUF742 domain-containing protein [Acidimicrobiales bacterium]
MSPSDDDPRVVPVYAITRGRTRSIGRDLPWESMVTATKEGLVAVARLQFELARIIQFCQRPMSVAEVAAELSVPLGVARVLVSDLSAEGLLAVHVPQLRVNGQPRIEILERLVAGLKAMD